MLLPLLALVPSALAACPETGACRVLPLGDSITDGYNVPGGYRINLEDLLLAHGVQLDFVGGMRNGPVALADKDHEGHSGWRIEQIDAILARKLLTYSPDVVLVHLGTNDIFQSYDVPGAPARMQTLVDRILTFDPTTTVFVAGIIPSSNPTYNALIEDYDAELQGLVADWADAGYDVHYVDQYSGFPSWMLADGVHPNRAGYNRMASVWYDAWVAAGM